MNLESSDRAIERGDRHQTAGWEEEGGVAARFLCVEEGGGRGLRFLFAAPAATAPRALADLAEEVRAGSMRGVVLCVCVCCAAGWCVSHPLCLFFFLPVWWQLRI